MSRWARSTLESIERIAKAEAEAAGAERMPEIAHPESTDALYNDPRLAARMRPVLESALGKDNVMDTPATMGSEDFSVYGAQGVPSFFITLGGADPAKWAVAHGNDLPSNHSSLFQVDLDPPAYERLLQNQRHAEGDLLQAVRIPVASF